jgi:heterodisulfide reductase subunit B
VAALRKKITSPLTGLKAAAYYGCYLVRPPEATGFDDPENPTILERLIETTAQRTWSGRGRWIAAAACRT